MAVKSFIYSVCFIPFVSMIFAPSALPQNPYNGILWSALMCFARNLFVSNKILRYTEILRGLEAFTYMSSCFLFHIPSEYVIIELSGGKELLNQALSLIVI